MFCSLIAHGIKRILFFSMLCAASVHAEEPDHGFRGEYILQRAVYGDIVCKAFKDNLNQFRKLDFDVCHPRISARYPQFSRPYEWKEIPFDLGLAERAIKSRRYFGSDEGQKKYHDEITNKRWKNWLKETENLRNAGRVFMWLTELDMDRDGVFEKILRLEPGARYQYSEESLMKRQCDYDRGELYVLSSGNLKTMTDFNTFSDAAADIVFDSSTNSFHLIYWSRWVSAGNISHPLREASGYANIDASRGLLLKTLTSQVVPGINLCVVDWVRKADAKPVLR